MFQWLVCLTILKTFEPALSVLSVSKVVFRTPREGDIGLIFDISIINTANEEKELLEYRIRPDDECSVNLTENSMIDNAGKIVGGSFGHIEPGAMQIISVIWPTTAIFNRVGYCKILIISTNVKNEEKELSQKLQFDTRFSNIDCTGTTFRRRKEYIECPNWDMDFMNNCTPVNCDEKYLGRRSYYNTATKLCEPVPKCSGNSEVYDIYVNECVDLAKLMDSRDIEDIRRGKYENNSLDLTRRSVEVRRLEARNINPDMVAFQSDERSGPNMWSQILSGLSIVLATVVIYTMVCFFIFLLVNWLSKISDRPKAPYLAPNPPKDGLN